MTSSPCRHLVLVLGDQLNLDAAAFDGFDNEQDIVLMAEVEQESTHVWTHKARIAVFLAAMRNFRSQLEQQGRSIEYHALGEDPSFSTLAEALSDAVRRRQPQRVIVVEPGEWRVRRSLIEAAESIGVELDIRDDRHFMSSVAEFRLHASARKQLRLEFFYREMRRRYDILIEDGEPTGGEWNYDSDNRRAFKKNDPPDIKAPRAFRPNETTQQVLDLVSERFASHPGSLENFDWPVTRRQALQALRDFMEHRLADFGRYQDAMWTDEPYLYHSRLSAAMNLKLLDPREVIEEAVAAYRAGEVPLNSVEGFVRQILGWREYVRGIYWLYMPEYLERNAMKASAPLPDFYWTADTDMECLRQALTQTLELGYAHHIQRLMVTGLFALLLGVDPKAVHEWYLAVYVDAVEWVELPNTLGMSQFADGGVMASKPYIASGSYIKRMSNYCSHCVYRPDQATGDQACPFTTMYWDYLERHQDDLQENPRMSLQLKNLARKSDTDRQAIRKQAKELRRRFASDESA